MDIPMLLLILAPAIPAIAPPYIPDDELALYPVIVAGRWNQAPLDAHHRVEGNVLREWEVRTELVIERVIRGEVKPGTQAILLGPFIGWEKDGPVMSYTSTEMAGDVEKVSETNLWFLEPARSRDKADTRSYWILDTYRGVQPLYLEPYFEVLMGKDADREIGKLLRHRDPRIILRALRFICGEAEVWPNDSGLFGRPTRPREKKRPLVEHLPGISKLLSVREEAEVRGKAAEVFASLAGPAAIPELRKLLEDRDPRVRGAAIGALARSRDEASIGAISRAAAGIEDGLLGCRIIEELEGWGDLRLVPAIIGFLQNDDHAYTYGDDFGIPAFKAREALERLTGHPFPCDVDRSLEAWGKAGSVIEKEERARLLDELLPGGETPVAARIVNDGGRPRVIVTNTSKTAIVLARHPHNVELRSSGGLGSGFSGAITGKESFGELEPGESFEFEVKLRESFLAAEPESRAVHLTYTRNGNEFGVNAWIGRLKVVLGDGWKE